MLFKKRCRFCGKPVKKDFNFCPYCGSPLHHEVFDELDEILEREFERIEKIFGIPLPRIKVLPSKKVTVKISGKEVRETEMEKNGKVKHVPKTIEEPEVKVEEKNGERIIRIKLPGVKDKKDIEITRLKESIEIKARAKDKMYFKIIPVKPASVFGTDFRKEELILTVQK